MGWTPPYNLFIFIYYTHVFSWIFNFTSGSLYQSVTEIWDWVLMWIRFWCCVSWKYAEVLGRVVVSMGSSIINSYSDGVYTSTKNLQELKRNAAITKNQWTFLDRCLFHHVISKTLERDQLSTLARDGTWQEHTTNKWW